MTVRPAGVRARRASNRGTSTKTGGGAARALPRTRSKRAGAERTKSWRRLRNMTAGDLLRPTIMAIHADTPLDEVARILAGQGISGAPVIDAEQRLVGVISQRDLARKAGATDRIRARAPDGFYGPSDAPLADLTLDELGRFASVTAASVMTRTIHSVPLRMPISDVARVLVERRIHRVLVESRGRLAGIISSTDILAALGRVGRDG